MGRVFVAGSINMDVVATAERHPAVGETVPGKDVLYFPGGKGANQAVAASRLGIATTLIGRVGRDSFGQELKTFLARQGVDVTLVQDTDDVHTGTAIITLAHADNTIVVIPGANGLVTPDDIALADLAAGDVAISQFEIPISTIAAFFRRARARGAITILNPAPVRSFDAELLPLVDVLVLNETELALLSGRKLSESDDAARFVDAARSLQGDQGDPARIICVTLGKRGAVALVGAETVITAGRNVRAVDTTGAGDCFVGALAARLAKGATAHDALAYANAAASICVQRMGAAPSMPTPAEVAAAL